METGDLAENSTGALRRYLKEKGESLAGFARRIGRSPSSLSRPLNGVRDPSIDLSRDVELGTQGAVPKIEFLKDCLSAADARQAAEAQPAQ